MAPVEKQVQGFGFQQLSMKVYSLSAKLSATEILILASLEKRYRYILYQNISANVSSCQFDLIILKAIFMYFFSF